MCPHVKITFQRKRTDFGLVCDVTLRCLLCMKGLHFPGKGTFSSPTQPDHRHLLRSSVLGKRWYWCYLAMVIKLRDILTWNLLKIRQEVFEILQEMFLCFFFLFSQETLDAPYKLLRGKYKNVKSHSCKFQ